MKRWRLKPSGDEEAVSRLTHDRCPEPAARLLAQRGLNAPEEASRFFRPDLNALHDPFLMQDMQAAVERIERALGDGERILVYGDYDVDGTTAVALAYSFLCRFTGNIDFYIPDRYAEGYGISYQGIDHAAATGAGLIIALDCGIKALDKVRYAREKGIDFVICDHHRPGDELPEAVAVLDPKRSDCPYPFKELSGCGIGFKLMQGLAQRNNIPLNELEPLLDLVAVSTACDIVPVVGENRILLHHGLRRFNAKPRPGFQVMLDMSNVKRKLTVTDLVFIIGPRINAAGRIEHGKQAVELLLAKDMAEAGNMGQRVDGNNALRQELDRDITGQALEQVRDEAVATGEATNVVYHPEWHKGVIGIVASRLVEMRYRPTVVLTDSNDKVAGSARSVKGFDVYEALSACSDLLEQFGGHMYAAGLTMERRNVEAFRRRFEEVVAATLTQEQRIPEEEIDLELRLSEVNARFLNVVEHMAPFGPGNMRPVFVARGVKDAGRSRLVGKEGEHLKLHLMDALDPGQPIDAIAFRQGHWHDLVRSGEPFSVVYNVEWNEWNGRRSLQLHVRDIKPGVEGVLVTDARSVQQAAIAEP